MTETAIAVVPGILFLEPSAHLVGSRCEDCGATFFPRRTYCRNAQCARRPTLDVRLSATGALYSFTTQHYVAPSPFRLDADLTPYTLVSVDLPEGIRIMGLLDEGHDPDHLRIGEQMDLTSGRLYTNADGSQVLTWKFRPRTMRA